MSALSESDLADLRHCAAQMRADGWASFVTYEHLLAAWTRLGQEVSEYPATVDDYTNDLSARSGLDVLLQRCHPTTAARVGAMLQPLDERFRAGTDPDDRHTLSHFFRIDDASGWWMRRIPKAGNLRVYLNEAAVDFEGD